MTEASEPLAGLRVLDLSRYVVGSIATRRLADLGADVVKVERPVDGDQLRQLPPTLLGKSMWHAVENRGKSSVECDSAEPVDRQFVRDLVDVAHVVVGNAEHRALAKYGVSAYEVLRRRPEFVACEIVPIGSSGPWMSVPAHGNSIDGLVGLGVVAGEDELYMASLIFGGLANEVAAHHAATAILAAVYRSQTSGLGGSITVSCLEAAAEANRARLLSEGTSGDRSITIDDQVRGGRHAVYRTADGLLYLSVIDEFSWNQFCRAIDRLDLASQWPTGLTTDYGDSALYAAISAVLLTRTSAEWQDLFSQWHVPGTPILSAGQFLASEQLQSSGLLHSSHNVIAMASPVTWQEGSRSGHNSRSAPDLGSDRASVTVRWL